MGAGAGLGLPIIGKLLGHTQSATTQRYAHLDNDPLKKASENIGSRLAAAMGEERFDLVLTGLQSDDQGHAQMGVMLAERLGIPHSTIIMEVEVQASGAGQGAEGAAGRIRVKRELEGGWFQWIAMPLPALLTIQSGINQLRYATLKGIMAAKKKEIRKVSPPPGLQPTQQIVSMALPTRSKQTHMISGTPPTVAAELVRRLREEARAL